MAARYGGSVGCSGGEGGKAMCQATVYLNGEVIMEEVIQINPTEGGVELRSFFGDPRIIAARIKEIDLIKHRVYLDSVGEGKR